jgi:hypothetical protein
VVCSVSDISLLRAGTFWIRPAVAWPEVKPQIPYAVDRRGVVQV